MSNQRKLHAPSASSVGFEPGMKLHALAASRNLNGVFNAPKVAAPALAPAPAAKKANNNVPLTEEEKEEEEILRAMFRKINQHSAAKFKKGLNMIGQREVPKGRRWNRIFGGRKSTRRSKSRRSKSRHSKTRRSK